MTPASPNQLFYGDNLDVLRRYVRDETVDLVYLDPPFNSNHDYNVLFAERGTDSAAQIRAFEDTWRWDNAAAAAYHEVVEAGGQVAQTMRAFRSILGHSDMLAYLSMMAPRLVELNRVLKHTGTIYLHCDPTASHYLKLLMDAVFNPRNFRNEIVWCYAGGGVPKKDFPRKHDIILRFTRSNDYYFSPIYRPYSAGTMQRGRTKVKGKYFDAGLRPEGTPVNDWWGDVPKITSPTDPEKLGYPTQKSEALLERILRASSQEGDLVLDPFCGCGTTVAVANRLERRWVGIDITHLAINLIRHRLLRAGGDPGAYSVVGEPVALDGARALAKEDPIQFQWWALGLVGARPVEQKRGADKGVDGHLYFHDADETENDIIISVKGGKTGAAHVRDLRGAMAREEAALGAFITLQMPTQPMRTEAASAGFYESPDGRYYPRLQILTVEELLAGKRIEYPVTSAGLAGVPTQLQVAPQVSDTPEPRAAKRSSKRDMESLVAELLHAAKIERPPVRLEPILENLNIELSADPRLSGDARLVPMTDPEAGPVGAWMVYYNPARPEARRRYTIAHEVGHVLLHGADRDLAASARGGGATTRRERDVERFAAELLMPSTFVRTAVAQYSADIGTLSGLFGVSQKAMEIRLRELRLP